VITFAQIVILEGQLEQSYMLVYSGDFESEEDAVTFCEAQYPDDDDDADDDFEESAFEFDEDNDAGERDLEPTCELWDELDGAVDPDYQEVVYGDARYEYLQSILINSDDAEGIESRAVSGDNTLIIIYLVGDNEDQDFSEHPDRLTFYGRYACNVE